MQSVNNVKQRALVFCGSVDVPSTSFVCLQTFNVHNCSTGSGCFGYRHSKWRHQSTAWPRVLTCTQSAVCRDEWLEVFKEPIEISRNCKRQVELSSTPRFIVKLTFFLYLQPLMRNCASSPWIGNCVIIQTRNVSFQLHTVFKITVGPLYFQHFCF